MSGCNPTIVDLGDKDGDSIRLDADCNDNDPEIGSQYLDGDEDGYGSGDPLNGCDQPGNSKYVDTGDDCNDSDASRYPGAAERCDGIDHNCDGEIQEEAAFYLDLDGDGYGLTSSITSACEAPSNYSILAGDCDDEDASIHPGAEESSTCNLKDDDCNGAIDDDTILDVYDASCDGNTGTVTPIAGQCGMGPGYAGDGDDATQAILSKVRGMTVDPSGDHLFVADSEDNSMIRRVDLASPHSIERVAGTSVPVYSDGDGDFSYATDAVLNRPRGLAADSAGNLYIADTGNNRIRLVNASGIILPVAGTGAEGATDGGTKDATFNSPAGLALDELHSILYVADWHNDLIRAIDLSGETAVVTTIAGGAAAEQPVSSTPIEALSIRLSGPEGVAVDPVRNLLYIADSANYRILRMNLADQTLTLLAGITGVSGNSMGSGQARDATFDNPINVAIAPNFEFLYVLDNGNARILAINQNDGTIRLAGGSTPGGEECSWTSGTAALNTQLTYPGAIAVGSGGTVYVADTEKFWVLGMTP